jgi:hypothetical protein
MNLNPDSAMSSRIKEALSIFVALALVAIVQYFAAKDCCHQVPEFRHARIDLHPDEF